MDNKVFVPDHPYEGYISCSLAVSYADISKGKTEEIADCMGSEIVAVEQVYSSHEEDLAKTVSER